ARGGASAPRSPPPTPLAFLSATRRRARRPGRPPCFYEIFTRLKSQSGQTARILGGRFLGVTPPGAPSPRTGCRTPPEWPLGGVFHAALQVGSWFRKPVGSEPPQLPSANVLCGALLGRSKGRSNCMALTTSRRSRMPTSLAIVSSALRSADTR